MTDFVCHPLTNMIFVLFLSRLAKENRLDSGTFVYHLDDLPNRIELTGEELLRQPKKRVGVYTKKQKV